MNSRKNNFTFTSGIKSRPLHYTKSLVRNKAKESYIFLICNFQLKSIQIIPLCICKDVKDVYGALFNTPLPIYLKYIIYFSYTYYLINPINHHCKPHQPISFDTVYSSKLPRAKYSYYVQEN